MFHVSTICCEDAVIDSHLLGLFIFILTQRTRKQIQCPNNPTIVWSYIQFTRLRLYSILKPC